MRAFRIATNGWESYGERIFTHPTKTKEDWETDCNNAVKESIQWICNKGQELIDGELEFGDFKIGPYFEANNLMEMVIEHLLKLGYAHIELESNYDVPGNDIGFCLSKDGQQELADSVGKELANQFIGILKIAEEKYLIEE